MFKIIFYLFCYCFLANNVFAQKNSIECEQCIDTFTISGYFVGVQTKNEINNLIKNKKRKSQGKSYSLSYSLAGSTHFFIPFDSVGGTKNFTTILNNLMKPEKKDYYALFSQIDDYFLRKEYGNDCFNYCKFPSQYPDFVSSEYYVSLGEKSKYCFQIYYLSAQWIKITCSSFTNAFSLLGRQVKYLKENESSYNIYILNKVIEYDVKPILNSDLVQLWKTIK